jgi:hypothetical protein
MKTISLKKVIAAGVALAGLVFISNVRADVEVLIDGGNASSSVLFNRATNIFNNGTSISNLFGASSSSIRTYRGTSTNALLSGLGIITLDFNLSGAVGGLQDIVSQTPEPTAAGSNLPPTAVDSSTSPDAVAIDPTLFNGLETYIVPYAFVKNTNSTDTAGITNLTQRQAAYLEGSGNPPATFFGGSGLGTNVVYFVGRNSQAAVRTEIDLNIFATGFQTYTTNALGQAILDNFRTNTFGNLDPGESTGSAVVSVLSFITNGIGTVAVQNIKKPVAALSYEGIPYSAPNVENGSYPLWNPEYYYYLNSHQTGTPTSSQLAVINALYQSVTNATFQVDPVYTNNFIPFTSLRVSRGFDGGPISPNPGY